jgi:hypothetical protein
METEGIHNKQFLGDWVHFDKATLGSGVDSVGTWKHEADYTCLTNIQVLREVKLHELVNSCRRYAEAC